MALQVSTSSGDVYVEILGQSDGPVILPIEHSEAESFQLATAVKDDRLRAVFHVVRGEEETIEHAGTLTFKLPSQVARLAQLAVDHPVPSPETDLSKVDRETLDRGQIALLGESGEVWDLAITILEPADLEAAPGVAVAVVADG